MHMKNAQWKTCIFFISSFNPICTEFFRYTQRSFWWSYSFPLARQSSPTFYHMQAGAPESHWAFSIWLKTGEYIEWKRPCFTSNTQWERENPSFLGLCARFNGLHDARMHQGGQSTFFSPPMQILISSRNICIDKPINNVVSDFRQKSQPIYLKINNLKLP